MEAEALRETRANNAKEADFRAHEHDPHPPAKAKEFPPSPPGWKGVRQSSPEAKPAATGGTRMPCPAGQCFSISRLECQPRASFAHLRLVWNDSLRVEMLPVMMVQAGRTCLMSRETTSDFTRSQGNGPMQQRNWTCPRALVLVR